MDTKSIEMNIAGKKIIVRLQGDRPQIFRNGTWESVARLNFPCGHSFSDEALRLSILIKIKQQSQ